MECISGKIIQGGDCYQKSRIKNQEDSLTTAYSRNDSAQCRTPLSGIWVREHRIPSAHVPGTRSSSGYLACFASRLPGPRNDGALLSDSAINQWVDDSMGPHSAPSELYGRGGGCFPPVSPEVIHIKPRSWLPLAARSSCRALPPPERSRAVVRSCSL